MKITASLSSRQVAGKAEIYLRISVSKQGQFRIKSHLYVRPDRFRDGHIAIPRYATEEQKELTALTNRLNELQSVITEYCMSNTIMTSKELQSVVDEWHNPAPVVNGFWQSWVEWESQTRVSQSRHKRYDVLRRILERMELRDGAISLDMTASGLMRIESYMRDEYKQGNAQMRGDNVINSLMSVLRTFINWAVKTGKIQRNPFADYTMPATIYGTPYYLMREERDKIAEHDYGDTLNKQRDVFVFQCLVGCRVSDLIRLTEANVVGNCLEYTPQKTISKIGDVVRVPLCDKALAIIDRYKGGRTLLPTISPQRYNDAIKALMIFAQIDRMVTILNPITHKEERKPLHEIASSHLARRTFIGNLYRQVQDPNLIGSMSGHSEGSKAFARYRTIDDDIKKKAIDLIK